MAKQTVDGAVLVVRLWRDASAPQGFRARILRTDDLASEQEETLLVASTKHVMSTVEEWLTEFLAD
jgi:hypothetical protein